MLNMAEPFLSVDLRQWEVGRAQVCRKDDKAPQAEDFAMKSPGTKAGAKVASEGGLKRSVIYFH